MLICSKRYYEIYVTAKLYCERPQCDKEYTYPNEYKLKEYNVITYEKILTDASRAGTPTGMQGQMPKLRGCSGLFRLEPSVYAVRE